MNDLLPVGSIVLLKNARKRLAIIGVYQVNPNENKIYDYIGVPYPEGFLNTANNYVFNRTDIDEVVFTGYTDVERDYFVKAINILYTAKTKSSAGASETKAPADE